MIYSYLLLITTGLVILRLLLSKNFAEALLSLDVMGNLVMLYLVLLSIYQSQAYWIDVAIVFAMFSFVGVMSIAKYMVDKNE
jgi:multicomponent Na+:H+ antiporter subunit F